MSVSPWMYSQLRAHFWRDFLCLTFEACFFWGGGGERGLFSELVVIFLSVVPHLS